MTSRIPFFVVFISALVICANGQTKYVTNDDLAKYKQERLKAEADYRQNYAKAGLPSPEELERRREQDRVDAERLSKKLRSERLEQERIDAEQQDYQQPSANYSYAPTDNGAYYDEPFYFLSDGRRVRRRQLHGQPGYFAGGHFWPTPIVKQRPRPSIVRPHH